VPKKYLPEEELEWEKIEAEADSMEDSMCEEVFRRFE
jgi:hypothetical protein